ncbi:MAG TPA: ParA family protein [Methylophilaceae bacterium]|nr:ParA family protein [Methylophilaceae bacterium]
MTRFAVFNQKGGVGKTTTVLNLSAALVRHGSKPLLIDMDPQGHLTQIRDEPPEEASKSLFGFYHDSKPLSQLEIPWENIGWLIPSHRELIKVDSIFGKGPAILNRLKQGLETLDKESPERHTLIDCCPYLGVLSLSAIFASDLVIIPIASDFLSLQGAKKVEKTLHALEPVVKRRIKRRYVMTCYDRRRGMTFEVHQQARSCFGDELCEAVISENVAVAESPQYKQDVFRYSGASTGAHDYHSLLEELLAQQETVRV